MSEKEPEHRSKIEELLETYFFPRGTFDETPPDLKTVPEIKEGIGIGWVSLYGLKREEDGTYTVALMDENNESAYKISGFSESEILDICNTGYKEICYREMEERENRDE